MALLRLEVKELSRHLEEKDKKIVIKVTKK